MSNANGILSALLDIVVKLVAPAKAPRSGARSQRRGARPRAHLRTGSDRARTGVVLEPGREPGTATLRVDPERVGDLRIDYAPDRDGAPDAGEIVWTWVPYEENDGRGKDRPVLVIARQSQDRVYAVRMTSKSHDGERDYLSIGTGPWDGQGRGSWVDIEQLYSVHENGLRREAAVLDTRRFAAVAQALSRRYGWRAAR
ncbi:type II toxin-antitoxin system PemK/MazF family toxin [Microbacterium sp. XT11]|uniref:type II toxin-antitoxin system PemK/MazF family toxin n=1 Tax=Microbacterium sp. XT11 TaxID=367477 RepID=UPI00082EDC89|nr:type II toxin-antitoxin system PemK/MazF family toxin [Microbacterium sp. XT11]